MKMDLRCCDCEMWNYYIQQVEKETNRWHIAFYLCFFIVLFFIFFFALNSPNKRNIYYYWIVAPLREKSEHLRPEILFLQIIFPLLFYILNIRWNSKFINVFMVTFITKKGNLFFPIRKLDEQLNWIRESDFWPSFPKDKSKIDLVLLALNWLLHLVSICHWNYEYSHLRWNEQLFNQSLRTTGFVFSFWMVELFQHVSN